MALVERFKQELMYGLSAKKNGRCREVAVSEGSTVYFFAVNSVGYISLFWLGTQTKQLQELREGGGGCAPTVPFLRVVRKHSVYAVNFDPL